MTWWTIRLRAWLSILRIRSTLSAPILTFIGFILNSHAQLAISAQQVALACISSFFMIAFAQVFNDIMDRRFDAQSKPYRPIPAGIISVPSAAGLAAACLAVSIAAACTLGWRVLFIVTLCLALGASYSLWLKGTVLVGNAAIAAWSSLSFPIGWAYAGTLDSAAIVGTALVFLFVFGNEIFKTAKDCEGDAASGITTIATKWGVRGTTVGVICCWLGLLMLFTFAHLARYVQPNFTVFAGATVGIPTSLSVFFLVRGNARSGPRSLERGHLWWRLSWAPGLISLFFIH